MFKLCPGGEIGRHKGLKIPRSKDRAGSSPASGTTTSTNPTPKYDRLVSNQCCDLVSFALSQLPITHSDTSLALARRTQQLATSRLASESIALII